MVESDRPQMTIWCIHIACRITKATDIHSEYVILIAFSMATMVARTHLNITLTRTLPVLLTLRRLMSYIYMEHPFLMFLDHTRRRSTVGRTPLDE